MPHLPPLRETPSQTAGPYLHIGLTPGAIGITVDDTDLGRDIAGPDADGERIRVEGCIFDGTGAPVVDALLEVWQADAAGIYAHPESGGEVARSFRGWGRVLPDADSGVWTFDTVKPGAVQDPSGSAMAPHITFWIVARGINIGLTTRMYFGDETAANASDPLLCAIAGQPRRNTLIAACGAGDETGAPVYRFDIRLQGDGETVFLDL